MDQHINVEDICRKEINFNNVQALNKKINKEKTLILCVNIRSINVNFEKLEILIESCKKYNSTSPNKSVVSQRVILKDRI